MSRSWLLSLLCLSALFLLMVPMTRAGGEWRVNEARSRVVLQNESADVDLAVENSTGEIVDATIQLELLDPGDTVVAKTSSRHVIKAGDQSVKLSLPFSSTSLSDKQRKEFIWYRLGYRLTAAGANKEGLISLSELAELFELRLSTGDLAREGGTYHVRVQASHPLKRRPAKNVVLSGEVTLEDDNNRSVTIYASNKTDDKGYALLDFRLPPRFPQFPHTVQPFGGEIKVTGRRGSVVAEVKGEVLVDQFAHTLITTDKPIYQPGQVIHVRALMFTPSKRALANHNVVIKITDEEDLTAFRTTVKSSRFGIVNADWQIPENTRLGDYRIWVGVEGEDESAQFTREVRVSRYELPNFTVNVEPDRGYYLPGKNATVTVRADYLFGKPVTQGNVRVVRENQREWNYREQKWEITEGDKYEGKTDASGAFVAHINLAEEHEDLSESGYQQFKDVTYAAYFTDPTTNRTEQRRFDLRLTKDPIHIYVIREYYSHDRELPLRFYVSTYYADGTPARCKVSVSLARTEDETWNAGKPFRREMVSLRTNRYGLAKVSDIKLPRELKGDNKIDLAVSAVDANGRKGFHKDDLPLENNKTIVVATDKSVYRAGEPINVSLTSSRLDEMVFVDVVGNDSLIRTAQVQLRGGRGAVTLPYRPDLQDRLLIVAYAYDEDSQRSAGARGILYPQNLELNVRAQTSQASYRPGEDAKINFDVRARGGQPAESALGVFVIDKAVEERFRTDQEFGQRSYSVGDSLQQFLGLDEQIAGVSLRDLQRIDTSKPVTPEMDLIAEILLEMSNRYYPRFYGGDQHERDQISVFRELIDREIKPVANALDARYLKGGEYPRDEATLLRFLSDAKIDFKELKDPWGNRYRADFSVDQQSDVITISTAGADEKFDTDDDFSVERLSWRYFTRLGGAIDRAVQGYHNRTGAFLQDEATLRAEFARMEEAPLEQVRDRWGQPYRFLFEVVESNYVVTVSSGGPDGKFSRNPRDRQDDFIIWKSSIDYFAEPRTKIQTALAGSFDQSKRFPTNDTELREALRTSDQQLESLRDPWRRRYYTTFKTQPFFTDRVRLENRGAFGQATTPQTQITPVKQIVAFVNLRSAGPDGKEGTADDFSVATFTGAVSEESRLKSEGPSPFVSSSLVLTGTNGALYGIVTDVNGAVIAGVKVTAKSGTTSAQAMTGETGQYLINNLPAGTYELRFERAAFVTTIITNVPVLVSNVTQVNAALEVGAITEAVTISDSAGSVTETAVSSVTAGRASARGQLRPLSKSGGSQVATPRLREYFPETLVWQPSVETDKQGRAQINFKLADNITTWKMAVIGSTEDGRVGAIETEIKAFQPFFVEHDPPRVLTEGDEISLPVVVRNYLERTQKVELEITPEKWFALLGPARKQTSVPASDAVRETFQFRATASVDEGKQRITAVGSDGADAIEKPIMVHPDGQELFVTASDVLGGEAELELNLPETTIPGSHRGELKIYPNLMAHVIEGVEAIMARPYGCAEQTISSTYPSLLLLRNYKATGADFPARLRAERYLKEGYSRLLNYREEEGGFSYWGHGDPDTAVTAYALRFLIDAAGVMGVDDEVIDDARKWLLKRQRDDGSWRAREYLNQSPNEHWSAVLTAYVTRILAMNPGRDRASDKKMPENLSASLVRALNYLASQSAQLDEPYLLASYMLAAIELQDLTRANSVLNKLRSLAHSEGPTTYWSLETNTPFCGWGLAGRVESTALVVQALTRYCELQPTYCEDGQRLVIRGLLFLLKQKDRYGVWYSTQATINVFDAMRALFATKTSSELNQAAAEVVINGRAVQTIAMPPAKELSGPIRLDISRYLSVGPNKVEIKRAAGAAFASVQAQANYYVPWSNPVESGELRLTTTFDKTEGQINDQITCHVSAERVAFKGYGMMLAEIGLPPGADVDRSSLETAVTKSNWALSRYDILPDRIVVYLWPAAGGVKFDFTFRPRFGLNAKTAPSVVYDYYNPESRAVVAPTRFKIR